LKKLDGSLAFECNSSGSREWEWDGEEAKLSSKILISWEWKFI